MSAEVDITGLAKADVLAALFNAVPAKAIGVVRGQVLSPGFLSADGADEIFRKSGPQFDLVLGRPLRVDLSGDTFDPGEYERAAGKGAAEAAIARLRERA